MRRDIYLGLTASLAIHGIVWLVGRVPNVRPDRPVVLVEKGPVFVMTPIEPDKPEPTDIKDEPPVKVDFAPPVQPEIFQPTTQGHLRAAAAAPNARGAA